MERVFTEKLTRKVEFARDALVVYINDHLLSAGERLPSYAQLRNILGVGSLTITQAIDSLCHLGILEVRDKVGIYVKNLPGGVLSCRTIGVAIHNLSGSAYSATLAGYIQKLLNVRNCRCLTFFQDSDPAKVPNPGLEDFHGLEQAVAEHRCDGIITCCPFNMKAQRQLKKAGIVSSFIGDHDQNSMEHAVVIDVESFISEAVSSLTKSGCNKIVQLCVSPEQARKRKCGINVMTDSGYSGGLRIAEKLLKLAEKKRPDGIISDDDTVVSGLLAGLIKKQLPNIRYMPRIATIVHKELEECYPSGSMILFEQSIEDFAQLAVDQLLKLIRGSDKKSDIIVYKFKSTLNS